MFKGLKKVIIPVICLAVLICCASCAVKSKVNVNAETAPIDSEWTFDHAVNKGTDVPRRMFIKDADFPHFSTDGETFTFNIVPEKIYSGTIVANGDGTYVIYNSSGSQSLNVTVEGNSLTVHITDDTYVVFVAK